LALRFQLQPEKLFRRAGIDLNAARAAGAGFSVLEVERLVDALVAATELPQIALSLGEYIEPESLGLFGQLIATAATPRDAVATFSDFKYLLHPSFDLRLEVSDGVAIVLFASNDETPVGSKPYYAEALLSSVASLGHHFLADRVKLGRATFRHPRPSYFTAYERLFRCPIDFDCAFDSLHYPARLLDAKLLGHSEAYHRRLRAQAETELRATHRLPVAQVRRVLHARIAESELDLPAIAKVLGVSTRTLQRRLGESGKSFRELHDEVRFQRARELLAGEASTDDVATALGYRDRANFVRAFTRWSRQSPSQYRAVVRGAK
jgi:AraC-like DNA-binding protein